jgi:hypothetical protein
MQRDALIAIAGGLMSAFASVAYLGGSALALIFVYLAPVPILLVGLGIGPKAATIAALTGFLVTGGLGGMLLADGGLFLAGVYGLMYALPAWIVARLVMHQRLLVSDSGVGGKTETKWVSIGPALVALALMASGFILIGHFSTGDLGLKGSIEALSGDVIEMMVSITGDPRVGERISSLLSITPGITAAFWVILSVINAVIAQKILVRLGRNLRPSPAYAELTLPQWASWPLVLSAGAALSGPVLGMENLGYLGRNTALVMATPYLFLGLAVIHTLARRVAATTPVLVAVYLVVLMSGWATMVVAGVGVIEQWIGLRGRSDKLDAGHQSGENE